MESINVLCDSVKVYFRLQNLLILCRFFMHAHKWLQKMLKKIRVREVYHLDNANWYNTIFVIQRRRVWTQILLVTFLDK